MGTDERKTGRPRFNPPPPPPGSASANSRMRSTRWRPRTSGETIRPHPTCNSGGTSSGGRHPRCTGWLRNSGSRRTPLVITPTSVVVDLVGLEQGWDAPVSGRCSEFLREDAHARSDRHGSRHAPRSPTGSGFLGGIAALKPRGDPVRLPPRWGEITGDTRPAEGRRLTGQCLDETEVGEGTTVTLLDARRTPEPLNGSPAVAVATDLGLDESARGLLSWDVFEAVERAT